MRRIQYPAIDTTARVIVQMDRLLLFARQVLIEIHVIGENAVYHLQHP